jgi:hypothetical protein
LPSIIKLGVNIFGCKKTGQIKKNGVSELPNTFAKAAGTSPLALI